ncbi:hypothetical protein [Geobacter sp. SVR]|uniref:hypothetical protein n=2 Tax=Geobacter sp. SVR TaxID=2495594 RepID=UPI001951E679|nr:hypothetical protein [Geobacter sp. SVR]BCS54553.1 hypothetical protein GSVR_28610 [Geobacter sp. SVR]
MSWKDMLGVSFNELEVNDMTFLLAEGIIRSDEGKVVKVSANGTVDLCAAEDVFFGKLIKIDTSPEVGAVRCCDCCVEVSYTGNPGLNYQHLVADGLGGVKPPAAAVAASLATGVVANNNALTLTAKKAGADGNDITITLIDPPGNNVALSVDVVGRDINVTLATDGASAITSTAALVKAAIEASSAADLVTVAHTGASTGAAAVVAVAPTNLAGGTDASVGRPMFVLTKDTTAHTLVMCCP